MTDDDEFWSIAMDPHSEPFQRNDNCSSDGKYYYNDDDGDYDDGHDGDHGDVDESKRLRYSLPHTDIMLELRPLPATDGVWSPVGADAWYASALLSSFLLTTPDPKNNNNNNVHPLSAALLLPEKDIPIIVLELGSGAVGLSGLACAAALRNRATPSTTITSSWKVLLTDNDPPVLEQLRLNVQSNLPNILPDDQEETHEYSYSSKKGEVLVQYLDWADENVGFWKDVSVVIGSELVYTEDTARACLKLMLTLLQSNPKMDIWVVQVTDRYGWTEIVIPELERHDLGVQVQSVPISSEIHESAATMIPMGGTLDRHAYGAFWIRRTSSQSPPAGAVTSL